MANLPTAFEPKLLTMLRQGYSRHDLRLDLIAGLTVAIVALPLAMALGIASGASPDKGLITAIIAGFLISALGGSRVQIGGPTGAFVVVVFNIIAVHGYDGLVAATLMAGVILLIAGYARLGEMIKFIPHPVVTGFTAGIAVIIATSQVQDFLGLSIAHAPAEFLAKWHAYWVAIGSLRLTTIAVGVGSLLTIIALRRWAPKWPGFLMAVVGSALVVTLFNLPVDTVGSRFPDMPTGIGSPSLPHLSLAQLGELVPSAFTIAFLAGIEALLSAVVADGMTGNRHRSNQELVGQGIANIGSALFGGLPATGAIARTATNIKSGARSPIAGIIHALFIAVFVIFGSKLMAFIPMAALAAILFMVAWGMSEYERFIAMLRMHNSDRAVLLLTFGLTVLVDLTVAIGVGVTLASLLFMARMSAAVTVQHGAMGVDAGDEVSGDGEASDDSGQRDMLPDGVEVFAINGPFFFGVAGELLDALRRVGRPPKVVILRMRLVPLLDASGVTGIEQFVRQARSAGAKVILSELQPQPRELLHRTEMFSSHDGLYIARSYGTAIARSRRLIDAA